MLQLHLQKFLEVHRAGSRIHANKLFSKCSVSEDGRCADNNGKGGYTFPCQFSFRYKEVLHHSCTTVDNDGVEWCSTRTDEDNNHLEGYKGNCAPVEAENSCYFSPGKMIIISL